jgi:hypothetical protein
MQNINACLYLRPEDRTELERLVADGNTVQKIATRARIVLASGRGLGTNAIMREARTSKPSVWRWQTRYMEAGIKGLFRDKGNGNKNMTTAERGAVITRHPSLAEFISGARGHGMTKGSFLRHSKALPGYDVTMLGYNYRLDELRAAIGLVQLKNLLEWNHKRRALTALYRKLFAQRAPEVLTPISEKRTSACHIMPVVLPAQSDRAAVILALRDADAQTTVHYPSRSISGYFEIPTCHGQRSSLNVN